jgi:HSP20 family molecular chaperone IbpA
MIDEVFNFPHGMPQKLGDPSFVYDSITTEKDGSSTITVVVPGFSREDLKIEASDGTLKLWCDLEDKPIKRYWKISDNVDVKKIKAQCKNGLLTISLPLKDKSNKTTTIIIE